MILAVSALAVAWSLRRRFEQHHRTRFALELQLESLREKNSLLQQEQAARSAAAQLEQQAQQRLAQQLVMAQSSETHLRERLVAQAEFTEQLKNQTRMEFENLAHQILAHQSKNLSDQTQKNVETLLNPLKERLVSFEKKIDDSYSSEAKERHVLKEEVVRLISLSEKMTQETVHLTQALKGDSKVQGDWGEMVLERVLENSGLRSGHEYHPQKEYQNQDGQRFKPDVVIHLPDQKHLIIDAKVSLTAYEQYCRAENPQLRQVALTAHLKSIQKHIEELSSKHYAQLQGLQSPEFVFLFMPIEPAYLLAMQSDPDLSTKTWTKNVAIVTASTLLTSLKTVASLWRLDNQNRNALEIAREGGRLYDKFVGFLEDFEKIGKTFEQGHALYGTAMGKLKEGPGNVFRKVELLRELGAAPQKRIRADLLARDL